MHLNTGRTRGANMPGMPKSRLINVNQNKFRLRIKYVAVEHARYCRVEGKLGLREI